MGTFTPLAPGGDIEVLVLKRRAHVVEFMLRDPSRCRSLGPGSGHVRDLGRDSPRLAIVQVEVFDHLEGDVQGGRGIFGVNSDRGRQEACLALIRGGMRLVIWGASIGLVFAFAVTRAVEGFLYGVSATDPVTFLGVPLLLLTVAALAAYVPARRASRVDPVTALRSE